MEGIKKKSKLSNYFTAFFSLFIKKEPLLNPPSEELLEELEEVNLEKNRLLNDQSFKGLKRIYEKYKVGIDSEGNLIAIQKNNGYVNEEKEFVDKVRFASLWRKSAYGDFDIDDEENCVLQSFSEDSEHIYEELKRIIQYQLTEEGNIYTANVVKEMKNSSYKWGRLTARRLFKTTQSANNLNNYFRNITSSRKIQTLPVQSLSQAVYCTNQYIILDKKD